MLIRFFANGKSNTRKICIRVRRGRCSASRSVEGRGRGRGRGVPGGYLVAGEARRPARGRETWLAAAFRAAGNRAPAGGGRKGERQEERDKERKGREPGRAKK
jgi:hypothetical protein